MNEGHRVAHSTDENRGRVSQQVKTREQTGGPRIILAHLFGTITLWHAICRSANTCKKDKGEPSRGTGWEKCDRSPSLMTRCGRNLGRTLWALWPANGLFCTCTGVLTERIKILD